MEQTPWQRITRAMCGIIPALIAGAAFMFFPWPVGRLLRSVSVPRFREQALRTSLTVLGVAFGVAVVTAVMLVGRSVSRSIETTFDDVSGKAALQVSAGSMGFDEALLERTREVVGVAKAAGVVQQTVQLHGDLGSERLLLLGLDLLGEEEEFFRGLDLREGAEIRRNPVAFLNSTHNIMISRALAERLGLGLHDHVRLATSEGIQNFEIWGLIGDRGVARAFGGSVAVMYYPAMQLAFGRSGKLDRIDVALSSGAEPEQVASALARRLGAGFSVERPALRSARVGKMMLGVDAGLTMASLIAVLVGAFLIYNTISISVVQRKRELGVLRALGLRRNRLVQLLSLEGLLLGMVASTVGVAFGIGLARLMLRGAAESVSALFVPVATAPALALDGRLVAGALLSGSLSALLAAWLPARHTVRIQPATSLRLGSMVSRGRDGSAARLSRDVTALLLLGASFLFTHLPPYGRVAAGPFLALLTLMVAGALWMPRLVVSIRAIGRQLSPPSLGPSVRLGNENLARDLGRASSTAAGLMVSVAMATGFSIFVSSFVTSALQWIDQAAPADLFVTSGARFGESFGQALMSEKLGDELAALPEVDAVQRVRIDDISYRGHTVRLLATDVEVYAQRTSTTVLEGSMPDIRAKLAAGAVIVSENFARHYGVHRGGSVELATRAGTRAFPVAGVIVDYTSDAGTILIERQHYQEAWADTRVTAYELYLRPDAVVAQVQRRIAERYGERFELFVQTNGEFKASVVRNLGQVFNVMRALELVAIAIGVLGLVNALFACVIDRVHELGVLRALGMSRPQLRRMIVTEAVLLGLTGALGGALGGLGIGELLLEHINLVQTGWHFPYRPSAIGIGQTLLLMIAAAAVAGYWPARVASSQRVADALACE